MRPSAVPPQAGHTSTLWRSRCGCGRVTPSTKSVGWTITGVGWLRRGICRGWGSDGEGSRPRISRRRKREQRRSGRCGQSAAAPDCVKTELFKNTPQQNQQDTPPKMSKVGVFTRSGARLGGVAAGRVPLAACRPVASIGPEHWRAGRQWHPERATSANRPMTTRHYLFCGATVRW